MKQKTIEGRLNKGVFSKLKKGDLVNWIKTYKNKEYKIKTKIIKIHYFKSFEEMYKGCIAA